MSANSGALFVQENNIILSAFVSILNGIALIPSAVLEDAKLRAAIGTEALSKASDAVLRNLKTTDALVSILSRSISDGLEHSIAVGKAP